MSTADETKMWWRFELTTRNEGEKEVLERLLDEKDLSRQELAIILFGIRVRPEYQRSDFGI